MHPKQMVHLIRADWERQREEAWRELHRRPDALPLPPEPEPGPSLRARLNAAIAAWLDPAMLDRRPGPIAPRQAQSGLAGGGRGDR